MRIRDWYFTKCIRMSARSAYTYLSVLCHLDDSEHDIEDAKAAVTELSRVDIWLKVYALPFVLRATGRETATQALHDAAEEYLTDMGGNLAPKFQAPCQHLLEALRVNDVSVM